MTYPDYIRQKAIRLRRERRLTIDEIAERLAISRTTAYGWVGHIEIPETERQSERRLAASRAHSERAREKRQEAYNEGIEEFDELAQDPTFRDFVCMYVGEGSKRCRNTVAVCNSDPAVVALANKWITTLGSNKVRYSIQYHADQKLDELRRFWSTRLGVPAEAIHFQRKSNSNHLTGRSWRSRYGVLTVSMGDTRLRARLQAWIDRVQADWS